MDRYARRLPGICAIVRGQCDDVGRQPSLVSVVLQRMTLGRAVLAEHLAGPPFRYRQHTADLRNRLAATGGA
jgi:hypothetical protein